MSVSRSATSLFVHHQRDRLTIRVEGQRDRHLLTVGPGKSSHVVPLQPDERALPDSAVFVAESILYRVWRERNRPNDAPGSWHPARSPAAVCRRHVTLERAFRAARRGHEEPAAPRPGEKLRAIEHAQIQLMAPLPMWENARPTSRRACPSVQVSTISGQLRRYADQVREDGPLTSRPRTAMI